MDSLNLPKLTKGYIIISVLIIAVIALAVLLLNNTLYLIDSNKNFTIAAIQNGKSKYVSKISSLYIIPRETEWLMFKTTTKDNIPGEEIIKPLTEDDLSIGLKKMSVDFKHQYDISTNGIESDGCSYGEHPNILSYACGIPGGVVAYDASDPLGSGSYVKLPPSTLDAYMGVNMNTDERTLGTNRYKDGLLVLIARQSTVNNPPLGNASLKFIDKNGNISDIEMAGNLENFNSGRYQLITDSGGSEGFGIIDTMKNSVIVYKSPQSQPSVVELGMLPNVNVNTACDLNNSILACYIGTMNPHTHSSEEDKAIKEIGDGFLRIVDTNSSKELASYNIPKDDPVTNLCVDKYKNIYTLTESSVNKIFVTNSTIKSRPVVLNTTSMSCGNNTHFVANNKAYMIDEDGSAHLVYESSLLPIVNIQTFADNVTLFAKFKSRPTKIYGFTATNRDNPYTKQRVSDAMTTIVDKNKNVDFEFIFTPNSIDYTMRTYAISDSDIFKDEAGMNAVLETTKQYGFDFSPKVHYLKPR